MKVYLDRGNWLPVYFMRFVADEGIWEKSAIISGDKVKWVKDTIEEFKRVQKYLRSVYED